MKVKATSLGLLVVGLLAGPVTASASPIYVGAGSAAGEFVEDILVFDPNEPSGQGVGATCRQNFSYDLQNIVADVGRPSVDLLIIASLVSTYVSGPLPELCEGGGAEQQFAFRIVEASGSGLSGSNLNGDITFDWTFNVDRTALAGPISFSDGRVPGYASLALRATVPEPGTFALLGLGLAGLVLSRRRRVRVAVARG